MKEHIARGISLLRRRETLLTLLVGAVLGVVVIGLIRFAFTNHEETHYHANFAVFINGQREQFKGAAYYQEVAACEESTTPLGLAHLHDENNHIVHVHGSVVTWGYLFTNLGWSLSNTMLYDGKTAYVDGQGGDLHFILNGKPTRSIADEVIGDRDRLLISYGNEDAAALSQQYALVPNDAKKADETADPSTCQGPEHESTLTRLQHAFLF